MIVGRLRLAAAVLTITTLGGCTGCEEVPLTREPDPPLTAVDWTTVWVAVLGAGLVAAAHLVVLARRRRSCSARRVVAGAVFAGAAVVPLAWWVYEVGRLWRIGDILDGGECRALSPGERPVQIVQLSCTTDVDFGSSSFGFEGLNALGVMYLTTITICGVAIAAACMLGLLRSDRPPWAATMFATAITVVLAVQAGAAVGESTSGAGWAALLAALTAFAVAAVASWREVLSSRRPPPFAGPPPAAR